MVLWVVSRSHSPPPGQEWTVQVKPLEGFFFFFFRNHFAVSVGLSQEKATVTLKKCVYSFNTTITGTQHHHCARSGNYSPQMLCPSGSAFFADLF